MTRKNQNSRNHQTSANVYIYLKLQSNINSFLITAPFEIQTQYKLPRKKQRGRKQTKVQHISTLSNRNTTLKINHLLANDLFMQLV